MYKEVLKILPRLEGSDLKKMERQLQGSFKKIATSFGKGIANIFKGGGIAGIALALIDKILNPLKETQDAIDRILKQGDDLVTNAKQFGTTAGKLFKLQQLAASTGLGEDNFFMLLSKFQSSVAEASADPSLDSSVRNYVGREDMADAFFEFIQQLQKMNKNDQVLVQQQVFGEKQILKMADFLGTDFNQLTKELGNVFKISSDTYTKAFEKTGGLSDTADMFKAQRAMQDALDKSKVVNMDQVRQMNESAKLEQQRETERISSYKNLQAISDTTTKIFTLIESGLNILGGFINKITPMISSMVDTLNRLKGSRIFKGIFGD